MLRQITVLIALLMLIALPVCAQDEAAEAAAPTKITMSANQWTAAKVAEEIQAQSGVQVAVTEWTGGSVTGELKDFELEAAIKSLGVVTGSSWIRFYMLETSDPVVPYTAAELLTMLNEARTAWFATLTDEQRGALFGGFGGQRGGQPGQGPGQWGAQGPGQGPGGPPEAAAEGDQPTAEGGRPEGEGDPPAAEAAVEGDQPAPEAAVEGDQPAPEAAAQGDQPEGDRPGPRAEGDRPQRPAGQRERPTMDGPGGAIAQPPRPEGGREGGEGQRPQFGGFGQYEDPVRNVLLPNRSDTITLELTDATVQDALSQFMMKTHMIVVADPELTGTVSLQVEDAAHSEALDAIAEAAGAKWRMVYVVSAPRQFTAAEIAQREAIAEQRREEQFNGVWNDFWAMSPAARSAQVAQRAEWMNRMADRMQERMQRVQARGGDPRRGRRGSGMARGMSRMYDRMERYSNQLTPAQRMEIKPLLEAMQRLQGGR